MEVITKSVESTWSVYSSVKKLDSYLPIFISCVIIACVEPVEAEPDERFTGDLVLFAGVVIACVEPVKAEPDDRFIGDWLLSSLALWKSGISEIMR